MLPFCLDPLYPRLVVAKPKNSVKEAKVREVEEAGHLISTRKRDGYRHLIPITKRGVRIYTRGITEVTDLYPHLVQEVRAMDLPYDTLLDGELHNDLHGKDDYEFTAKVANSLPTHAHVLQKERGHVRFAVLNVILLEGNDLCEKTFYERLAIMRMLPYTRFGYLSPMEVLDCSFVNAKRRVKRNKWEGLVLYHMLRTTAYRLDGNTKVPPRPEGTWKWKPRKEDDFIVRKFAYGSGRNANRMGKLFLSQIDPATGKEAPCGEVGAFKDVMREYFAHEAAYPLVVQVSYQKRFTSGALQSPVFMRIRREKSIEECVFSSDRE